MTRYIPAAALLALLAGCSAAQQQTTVASVSIALTAAEASALRYVTLPACAPGETEGSSHTLCSQTSIVAQIKQADNVASNALGAARNGAGSVAIASAAVAALTALIPAGK